MDPRTSCAFLGTTDIEPDLDGLDQPWMETLRVVENSDGELIGAIAVEWDPEVSTAWIYGPWLSEEISDADAASLIEAIIEQTEVNKYQMYTDVKNTRVAELASKLDWSLGSPTVVFTANRHSQAEKDDAVRAATTTDLESVKALHEAEFPGTYATAEQLLADDGDYTTLVLEDENGLIGYVSGQEDDGDVYLDFVAVDSSRRRTGAGTRLVKALVAEIPGEKITLTCDETQPAAIALYKALGWEITSQTRAFNLESE